MVAVYLPKFCSGFQVRVDAPPLMSLSGGTGDDIRLPQIHLHPEGRGSLEIIAFSGSGAHFVPVCCLLVLPVYFFRHLTHLSVNLADLGMHLFEQVMLFSR